MQTRGAIVRQAPGKYEVVDLEVDDPRPGEIQVKLVASGLCHSDDHVATGDIPVGVYPIVGGHEGAGIVRKAAPANHKGLKEGDHVVFSFLPSCGHCRWCATGHAEPVRPRRRAARGLPVGGPDRRSGSSCRRRPRPVGQMCGISTFCETTTVSADSCVKVDDDMPLDKSPACVGCGVATGWGSAVNAAERAARAHRDRHGHRRHRHQRGPGRRARRRGQRHRRRPAGDQAREGRGARRHARRRDHGGGHRAGQAAHPRPGRRHGDHHRRHHQARGRRAGDGLDPQGRHRGRHRPRQHRRHHARCRSRWPT